MAEDSPQLLCRANNICGVLAAPVTTQGKQQLWCSCCPSYYAGQTTIVVFLLPQLLRRANNICGVLAAPVTTQGKQQLWCSCCPSYYAGQTTFVVFAAPVTTQGKQQLWCSCCPSYYAEQTTFVVFLLAQLLCRANICGVLAAPVTTQGKQQLWCSCCPSYYAGQTTFVVFLLPQLLRRANNIWCSWLLLVVFLPPVTMQSKQHLRLLRRANNNCGVLAAPVTMQRWCSNNICGVLAAPVTMQLLCKQHLWCSCCPSYYTGQTTIVVFLLPQLLCRANNICGVLAAPVTMQSKQHLWCSCCPSYYAGQTTFVVFLLVSLCCDRVQALAAFVCLFNICVEPASSDALALLWSHLELILGLSVDSAQSGIWGVCAVFSVICPCQCCVCVCACILMCIHVCVCVCACVPMCIHMCVCVCVCVCMRTYVQARVCVCMHAYLCACTRVCVPMCLHVCVCVCVCACVPMCMHVCVFCVWWNPWSYQTRNGIPFSQAEYIYIYIYMPVNVCTNNFFPGHIPHTIFSAGSVPWGMFIVHLSQDHGQCQSRRAALVQQKDHSTGSVWEKFGDPGLSWKCFPQRDRGLGVILCFTTPTGNQDCLSVCLPFVSVCLPALCLCLSACPLFLSVCLPFVSVSLPALCLCLPACRPWF